MYLDTASRCRQGSLVRAAERGGGGAGGGEQIYPGRQDSGGP
jgi:hypothetical protein